MGIEIYVLLLKFYVIVLKLFVVIDEFGNKL